VWAPPELLGAPTISGGSARPWGGGGEVIYTFTAVRNSHKKNGEKTGGFAHVLAYKSPKTLFFAQKYLTRYTYETFFEEYTNFQAHYLSHCKVIPLQSFGSHIRPQPHGLGLTAVFATAESIETRINACSFSPSCALFFTWRGENVFSFCLQHST
jgi:hypothetical protein